MLLAMVAGAFVHGVRFRIYSLATLLTVIVFAGVTFQQVTLLAAHEPAPYLGLLERVNIYAWMLWVAALSMSFLHSPTASRSDGEIATSGHPAATPEVTGVNRNRATVVRPPEPVERRMLA